MNKIKMLSIVLLALTSFSARATLVVDTTAEPAERQVQAIDARQCDTTKASKATVRVEVQARSGAKFILLGPIEEVAPLLNVLGSEDF